MNSSDDRVVLFWFIAFTVGAIAVGTILCIYAFKGLRRAKNPAEARVGLPEGCLIALIVIGIFILLVGLAFAGCGILLVSATGGGHRAIGP